MALLHLLRRLAPLLVAVCALAAAPAAQGLRATDAYLLHGMLTAAYDTVKQNYYDRAFHGLDWDARFREYDDKLKAATSLNAGLMDIARFLAELNDSHTYFQPPPLSIDVDYGYQIGLIGDEAFVTRVRPGTDAASKVAPGDRIVTLNGLDIDRAAYHRAQYLLQVLSPQTATTLVLRDPAGRERTVTVTSTVTPRRITRNLTNGNEIGDLIRQRQSDLQVLRQRHAEIGDVMIWKMPAFLTDRAEIDGLFALARRHAALILDLRGNSGGFVEALRRMVSNVCDHDVPIATRVTRNGTTSLSAATRGNSAYRGTLVVLVDSASASAAEIFARVVQLERRGTVVGDRTAGAVMEARAFPFPLGNDPLMFYAFSVTDADLVMRDGKSLEGVGVTPDETRLSSAEDLAAGRDPVLARAAELVGLALDPTAAGRLLPFEWRSR